MNKDVKSALITILVIATIITGAYFGGIFSVLSSSSENFRQEPSCGGTHVYQFDKIVTTYTTTAVDVKIVEPDETDANTECIITAITIKEDNVVLFEYEQSRGIIIDKMSPSPDYYVMLNDERKLDDGTYYKMPNNIFDNIDVAFYTTGLDTTLTTALDSENRLIGEPTFSRLDGFYSYDIDNDGYDRNGNTIGTQLYFRVIPAKADLDSDVTVVDGGAVLTIANGLPSAFEYADVCMNFGVTGFAGGIQYDTTCLGVSGTIDADGETEFVFEIPETNASTYYLRGDVMDMYVVSSSIITTQDVYEKDIDDNEIVEGTKVFVGNLIGDVTEVNVSVEPVEEEPGQVDDEIDTTEEPVDDTTTYTSSDKPEIEGYTYLIMGAVILLIAIVAYMRFSKKE